MGYGVTLASVSAITAAGIVLQPHGGLAATQCGGADDEVIRSAVVGDESSEHNVVVDWATAGQVEDLCPEDIRDGEISAGTKLYVWMRAAGNKAALERLVDERRLPLRHVWSKKAGPFWNVVETIRVSGDDLSDTDIQGLMREASERGFLLDWRTYSNKEHLESGLLEDHHHRPPRSAHRMPQDRR